MLLNCGVGEDSWEFLELQGDQTSQSERKSALNIHCKDWYWSWNSNTLATWCEELTPWKRPWCWERLRAGGEGDEMAEWHHWLDEHESEQAPGDGDGQGSRCAAVHGLQRVGQDWVAELNWWWFLYLSTIFYINSALLGTLRRERKYKWQFVYPLTR